MRRTFGEKWFDDPLPFSLRFELAQGSFWTNRLGSAIHRAMTIVDAALGDTEDLHLGVIGYFEDEERHERDVPSVANSLAVWGLPSLGDFATRTHEPPQDGESLVWEAIAPLDRAHAGRAIWAALACDFWGVLPPSPGRIQIVSCSLGLICNPYDDRGMDVGGLSQDTLQHLYTEYNEWLLDYNRPEMDAVFGL